MPSRESTSPSAVDIHTLACETCSQQSLISFLIMHSCAYIYLSLVVVSYIAGNSVSVGRGHNTKWKIIVSVIIF